MFQTLAKSRWIQTLLGVALVGCTLSVFSSSVHAADAYSLDKNIDADGLAFGGTDAFAFGVFANDDTGVFMGNDILVQTQTPGACCNGAGISVPISNGENGYTETFDTLNSSNDTSNPDVNNATPPNPAWAAIGNTIPPANQFPPNPVTGTPNPRVGLNNGNVLRYSMWVREDPNNPITAAPQIEPVFKFEFYKEALSTHADNDNSSATYGDKVYDTDQYESQGVWIDLDGNGTVADASASAANGRVKTISDSAWTLIEVTYEVDDTQWFGIDDDLYTVADIEEVRAVMFWGDFDGDNGEAGSLWFDNVLVEVFPNAAAVTANTNPDPSLDEGLAVDGDYDGDGFVSQGDLDLVLLNWGQTAPPVPAGWVNQQPTGLIGQTALDGVLLNWGNGTPPVAGIASVPEPGSALLVALAAFCLGSGRRRR